MVNISAGQIRAARGLLDWSREELAQKAGLSPSTIRNLEKGFISPRGATASGLCCAFEGAGIFFTPDGGLRQEIPDVKAMQGIDCIDTFFENLLQTAKQKHGEIIGIFSSQATMLQSLGIKKNDSLDRLGTLAQFASIKFIVSDLDESAIPMLCGETRTVSKYCVTPSSLVVYGNNHVIIQRNGQNDHRIITVSDPRVAVASREHFYMLWEIAAPLVAFGGKAGKFSTCAQAV